MSLITETGVSASDRLSFTVFVAVALHGLAVLTDFIQEDPTPAPFTMEITLSRYDDDKQPDKADFLAQTNQLGSGTEQDKSELSAPTLSTAQNSLVQESASIAQKISQDTSEEKPVVVTQSSKFEAPVLFDLEVEKNISSQPDPQKSFLERSLEIAQLEANFDTQLKNYARRPRVTRLTAASTMKAIDARYVESVVAKIERTGKLHFPADGGKKLYGKPRVSIAIYSDGSIKDITVLQSSGSLVLDSKTVDIVRRSSPFGPFPKEVRKERDVLELIRTFSYTQKGVSSF